MATDGEIQMQEYVDRRLADHCDKNNLWHELHLREHALLENNIKKAGEVLEYRLEVLNEWKQKSQEDRITYVSRAEYEASQKSLHATTIQLAERNELALTAKATESKTDVQMLAEKQQASQTWIRNLLVAVIILMVGVVTDLIVMLTIWQP